MGDDGFADDEVLYERYGDDVLFAPVAHDELYERFGHDGRYLHDELPYRDPNLSARTHAYGWATGGIADAPRTDALMRSMFLWLLAIILGVIAVGAVVVLVG